MILSTDSQLPVFSIFHYPSLAFQISGKAESHRFSCRVHLSPIDHYSNEESYVEQTKQNKIKPT